MKKNNLIILVLTSLFCLIISCEKEEFKDWLISETIEYTLPELQNEIGLSQYDCNDTLDCEGKYVMVTGYIIGSNVSRSDSKFILYSNKDTGISQVFNQKIIDVRLNEKEDSKIFQIIENRYKNLPDNTWKKVRVTGTIYGWNMQMMSECKKSIGLYGYNIKMLD